MVDILTPTQLRMVKMTWTGASDQQIAHLSGIAEQTVKNAFSNAHKATGARNRTHLAVMLWWELEGKPRCREQSL